MRALTTLYRGEQWVDFYGRRRIGYAVSAVLVLLGVVGLLGRGGLNLGIDFEGGIAWTVPAPELSVVETRDAVAPLGIEGAKIQSLGGGSIQVQAGLPEDPGARDELEADVRAALAEAAGVEAQEVSLEEVGPSWGDAVTSAALRALVFFFIVIALYITLRFEWKMAIAALAAVAHDITVSVGVYALFQFEVTPATVIAFLTIMGYSLYDTIVVFDRVNENAARMGAGGRAGYAAIVNTSNNDVLMRSLNTTITSVLPVLSMLVIGSLLLGAVTLQEFALALLVGLAAGTYSSLFVASPLLVWLKQREPRYQQAAARSGPVWATARGSAGGERRRPEETGAAEPERAVPDDDREPPPSEEELWPSEEEVATERAGVPSGVELPPGWTRGQAPRGRKRRRRKR